VIFQPILLVVAIVWMLSAYLTYRGFACDEFIVRGAPGWHRYEKWSFGWILGTTINLLLVGGITVFFVASIIFGPLRS
jgi:hypothetical protein